MRLCFVVPATAALLALGLASPARAQNIAAAQPVPVKNDPVQVDPNVTLVLSGGRWESGRHRGSFRMVLVRPVGERVGSRVVVQWLAEEPGRPLTVHSSRAVDAIPATMWSIGVPVLERRDRVWYAVIPGTTDGGRIRRTWRFALDAPGKLREVQLR